MNPYGIARTLVNAATLADYTSRVERARRIYALEQAEPIPPERPPRPCVCGADLPPRRQKCDDCRDEAYRERKRIQQQRVRDKRKKAAR